MSCLESLITADRIVLAGLKVYDESCARVMAENRRLMAAVGHSDDEIEEAAAIAAARILEGRGRLHRELWTKALAFIADHAGTDVTSPDKPGDPAVSVGA